MKKAFAYYRKSIEREAEKSLQGQKEVVRQYAAENEIEIVEEFAEVASSATVNRIELNKMFRLLNENEDIDYILVHRFDRVTREVKHMGYIMTLLDGGKTRLHSVTEVNDYEDDPTKLMMIMMQTYGATIERMASVERMQAARRRKQGAGGFIGGTPPMGYQSVNGTGRLIVEESEVPIVQDAFLFRQEGLTMEKIAEKLNQKGYLTRKNKKFYAATVHRILKYQDWYKGQGQAPPIL